MYEKFSHLVGMTLSKVWKNDSDTELNFLTETGVQYRLFHVQDCCESVYLEDIVGDLEDLIGSPILQAEEASTSDISNSNLDLLPEDFRDHLIVKKLKDENTTNESETWTFYKLATFKGYVTLRWYGTSNGYYSESVDFERME